MPEEIIDHRDFCQRLIEFLDDCPCNNPNPITAVCPCYALNSDSQLLLASPASSARRRLPNRRVSETFDIAGQGLRFTCTASLFDSGELAEIFLSNTKPLSQSDVNVRGAAVAASLAFQFGCPLETLRRALLRDSDRHACGPLAEALDRLAEVSS
jgi:hypothetical protein